MQADNAVDARLALRIPLRTLELPQQRAKRVRLPRVDMRRRTTPGQGAIALSELGRETGARC